MALPTSHNVVTAAQLGSTLSSYNTKLNARFKPKQTAVDDPTASGTTTTAIASISQDSDGAITVTKKTISGVTPASHAHGNITNGGALQTNDVTVASGDKLVVTDSSDSSKVARTSISFDGSTTTKALTPKGTWETFNNYSHPTTTATDAAAVKIGKDGLGHVVIGAALSKSDVGLGSVANTGDSATPVEGGTTKFTTGGAYTELAKKANLASPALTGTPTAPTASAGTNTTQIATTAFVKAEIDSVLDAADAMQFKGTIGASADSPTVTALPNAHKAGWTYKVVTAGTYASKACEIGDMIICVKDGTAAADADWTVVQNNIDGAVTGPTSAVDARVAVFNGTTGKVIKDSGFTIGKSVPSNAAFTDVSVTAAANHYTPSRDTSADKSASASGATAAWSIDVVKGVTLQTDGKGHVTGVAVTSGKIPANPNTDTKVTSASNHYAPETASGSEIAASASGAEAAWSIDVVKGVSLDTDGKGHVTGISVTSGKIPSNPNTDTKVKATAKTDNANYKILATASASPTSGNATEAVYDADITLNPSTNTIAANISGDAATASAAKSGSALETAINGKAASGHTHTTTIATSSGTSELTLAHGTKYAITAGGTSFVFTMPNSGNTDTKVTQTALAGTETDTYPVLLAPTGQTSTATTTSNFATALNYKPSTNTLAANISGDAATASAAASGSALETAINGKAASSHSHGNVTSGGAITATAVAIASGDALTIVDSSASGKLVKSTLTFDGSTETKCLTQKGTWATFGTSNLTIGTTASTAAAGNHTHTTSMATSTGTASITLEVGTKYSLSAGGTSYVFQNGTEMTDQEVTDLLAALT